MAEYPYFRKMFRHILIFGICLLLSLNLLSQDNNIQNVLQKADLIYDENPAESYALCERAEREAAKKNDPTFKGDINLCKARYLILIASFDAAMRELNSAILFFEDKKDTLNLSQAYSLKSLLLRKMGDFDASHHMILDVLELQRQQGNTHGVITNLLNITLNYENRNEPDSVLSSLKELQEMTDDFNAFDFYYYYQNWGMYYRMVGNYEKAIQQYKLALEVTEQQKMTDAKATGLMNLSRAYRLNGMYDKADKYAKLSYEFSEENNLIYEAGEALEQWIKVKEEQGDYKNAFEIQKKWVRVNSEIYNLEKVNKVKAIEGQLQIAQKEKQIAEGEIALQKSKLEGQKARTKNAWLFAGIVIVIILLGYTAYIYKKTKKLNKTISLQKDEVEVKSLKLEDALISIEDSLEYSKLIQSSMLPSNASFKDCFEEFFVLYQPKDIVSGDFYWLHKFNERVVFAVGDCTGHGVPGAMVSMVCNEALNKVVIEQAVQEPGEILNKVREIVSATFKSDDQELNDGMDIALCSLSGKKLSFAGAYNAAWIFRNSQENEEISTSGNVKIETYENNQLIELKADKQPIGKYYKTTPFKTETIDLLTDDKIYLFSDGYADQFGGEKGKKLKAANFKKILAKSQNLSLSDQHTHLKRLFEEWKGDLEQLDDICVIGVKI